MTTKSKLAIIEETYQFYTEDPSRRAMEEMPEYRCEYITEDGRNCAVGRYLVAPKQYIGYDNVSVDVLLENYGVDIFKPEYRIDNPLFWTHLQKFHDSKRYWNERGLTEKGQAFYERLKKNI